ncbi:MBL fold metallo-hydrolase [Chitinophagaceae bacterium MMS25-I14]
MKPAVFGKNPSGERLEKVKKSPNYKDSSFQNLSETPVAAADASYMKMICEMLNRPDNTKPPKPMPHVKTDLRSLSGDAPVIVWFGHSSYFLRVNGRNILVDPVFSGNASPVPFMVSAFEGSNVYSADDMPELDVLVLTHDHYDHLDYQTILQLKSKVKHFCTSLGVGSHLEHWGIDAARITEFDWWESSEVLPGMQFTAAPSRHFSGRGVKRAQTLWSSFILKTPEYNIYLGGDSGYDSHFKEIGERFGPFDLAILECGQYNKNWPYIHMMPEETARAAADLGAKVLLPVHWGKFVLAMHPWNESIERVLKAADELGIKVITPMIGEPVELNKNWPERGWWNL